MIETATRYLAAGLSVLPAVRAEKRPALSGWKAFQSRLPSVQQVEQWFAGTPDALCIVAGAVSGHLEVIDFDHQADQFEAWTTLIPPELLGRLVIERTQSGGRHLAYRCEGPVCGNMKLSQALRDGRLETLIETRGEGGLFLCDPTPGYTLEQGMFTELPILSTAERESLLEAAWSLNEYLPPPDGPSGDAIPIDGRPGDEFNERGDVREVLVRNGWTLAKPGANEYWRRPGKSVGWSATLKDRVFYVFSGNAAPFEPNRAYSPFSVITLLEHGGDFGAAASGLRTQGFGQVAKNDTASPGFTLTTTSDKSPAIADPGPIPEDLFHVPGFVQDVVDFILSAAPYPNVGLAFCGALALQSFLAGRKVCTSGDLRTNLYLLALASSGTGKEFPRKVNSHILFRVGLAGALGDKFASGEGIQDTLLRSGMMLFQNDEMDGVLRQINSDHDNRRESIPNILLTLYTSASDIYPTRVKAGQKEVVHIDQPHLTLFGTATPQFFYESLSRRMLTNGFFARLSIVD
ncbi:MAG: bifunctional DNA primase/polymerase, partial [Candidatus Sericytochromatia bacterium]|nr:bifunctional DNA primase/polymerase [Candidatus Tanganyikabacteria bacterium]